MKIFTLPDLGEGLPSAEIHAWHVKEGDIVVIDQILVSVETAKAVVDVPSPYAGKIVKLHGKIGDVIDTHAALVEFAEDDDQGSVVGKIEHGTKVLHEAAAGVRPTAQTANIKILPAVRALAKRLSVDLTTITPTGSEGQITEADVEQAAHADFVPITGVRRAMAEVMSQSHKDIVPVTLVDDVDVRTWSEQEDVTVRLLQAIVKACAAEPSLNAWFEGKTVRRKLWREVHVGLAIDTPEGLFVANIKNVGAQTPDALRADIERLKTGVKNRTLPSQELQGYTFMLTNFGTLAGRYATPIITPPCVAILGTGKIREHILPLSLTIDHRAVTGGEAARFLKVLMEELLIKA